MKMIAHETPGMDLPAGFLARLAERVEEATTVSVVAEDRLAMVAAAHEVVDDPANWTRNDLGMNETGANPIRSVKPIVDCETPW